MEFAVTSLPSRRVGGRFASLHLMLALALAGTNAAAGAQTDPQPTDFRADLGAVQQFLDRDKSYSPAERARAVAELDALKMQAAHMSAAAFQLAVAHIAALSRNGHTMLVPGPWPFQFNRVGLRYHLFADGLFVIHAPDPMRALRGARVIAIDGHDLGKLKRVFARYSGAIEPKRNEWIALFLESPALLHAAGVAKVEDRVRLDLELPDGPRVRRTVEAKLDPPGGSPFAFFGKSRLVEFAAENTASVPLYLAQPERAFRLAPLPDLHAYYVQLRANVSTGGGDIEEFVTSALATLRKVRPRYLIVDLRLDGGGDLNTTRAFIKTLPGLIPRGGRIFALTSGRTFSAGIANLGCLKQAGGARVTIAGEPIGDHLEFWAEGDTMELPVSKAVLLYATERHNYMTGCPEADCHIFIRENPIRVATLKPDLPVPLTHEDYRAGRDRLLGAVRKALGK